MATSVEQEFARESSEILPTFPKISPSALKLVDEEHPEIVTKEQMTGSIRGYAGHTLDNTINLAIRSARIEAADDLHEKLMDIPQQAQDWFYNWRSQHIFYKSEKRSKTSRRIEGEVFSADSVQDYWESRELTDFADAVIEAHEKNIKAFVNADDLNEELPFPILVETDPKLNTYSEEGFIYNAKLGNHQAQIALRRDYMMYDSDRDQIIITDAKFGSNVEPSSTDVMLYSMFANRDINKLRAGTKTQKPSAVSKDDQRIDNILFYYRVLDKQRGVFVMKMASVRQAHSPEEWFRLTQKISQYKDRYRELRRALKIRNSAFVMPQYIGTLPESVDSEIASKQKRLIYVAQS